MDDIVSDDPKIFITILKYTNVFVKFHNLISVIFYFPVIFQGDTNTFQVVEQLNIYVRWQFSKKFCGPFEGHFVEQKADDLFFLFIHLGFPSCIYYS